MVDGPSTLMAEVANCLELFLKKYLTLLTTVLTDGDLRAQRHLVATSMSPYRGSLTVNFL
jgi:hypothetical protein